jgi:hypothetical protein
MLSVQGGVIQISARYDIYDAVLRKLWGMAEKGTGVPLHALQEFCTGSFFRTVLPSTHWHFKARSELRRTPRSQAKGQVFNLGILLRCQGGSVPRFHVSVRSLRAARTQCFGGMFDSSIDAACYRQEAPKPVTATTLRPST